MELVKARVKVYKAVIDSEWFTLEDLTCLVGKNESGKTAILEALEKINAARTERGDFRETDYPRVLSEDYNEGEVAVETVWSLSDEEVAELGRLAGDPGAVTSRQVTVTKNYGNELGWSLPLNMGASVEALLASGSLNAAEAEPLKSAANPQELIKALGALPEPTPKQTALHQTLSSLLPNGSLSASARAYLRTRLPVFVYYAEYDRLPGRISVNQVIQHRDNSTLESLVGANVFMALLSMVGTSLDDLVNINTSEALISKLEGVESRMSKRIFKYWSQNKHLKVRFRFHEAAPGDDAPFNTGKVFQTRIENTRHEATISLDERSTGFIWFFSFLVWFSEVQKTYGENLIVLLDEPGLSLHAKAQEDLLRFINEELLTKYQVIYSTHSPFMIDSSNLLSCRTVEDVTAGDGEVLGTKVNSEVLKANGDTLFPLRAALGYDISQSLFVGEHTLLVEGPSDLLYIQWASQTLDAAGRVGLDHRWTVTPCGGITKVPSFLALFSGNNLHVAVLADLADGVRNKVREIQDSELLQDGHVFVATDYSANERNADTEDILGRAFYVDLINAAYGLTGGKKMPAKKAADADDRVVEEAKTFASDWSDKRYDHYTPSKYLITHPEAVSGKSLDEALDNFERLFKDLNELLP
ncbi:AAA family ATPase [Nocardioides soli]|uniref:Putative ATPase n=1 Tax=Nocardioides soli TaxID=1036020 RepID=A0A7W4Z2C5_9ACTN|nr:AAA family ATPase [Nocardioides soli]MBB3042500.1 putative ATPase [Nocardioides soli]